MSKHVSFAMTRKDYALMNSTVQHVSVHVPHIIRCCGEDKYLVEGIWCKCQRLLE